VPRTCPADGLCLVCREMQMPHLTHLPHAPHAPGAMTALMVSADPARGRVRVSRPFQRRAYPPVLAGSALVLGSLRSWPAS